MVHSCYGQRQKRNEAKFQWRQFKNNYDTVTEGMKVGKWLDVVSVMTSERYIHYR